MLGMAQPRRKPQSDQLRHGQTMLPVRCEHRKDQKRLKPQAEEIIKEDQAGFRGGRSTTGQNFNLRILCEKYLQHQQNLCHVFIDFQKAFNRVSHAAFGVPTQSQISKLLCWLQTGLVPSGRDAKPLQEVERLSGLCFCIQLWVGSGCRLDRMPFLFHLIGGVAKWA